MDIEVVIVVVEEEFEMITESKKVKGRERDFVEAEKLIPYTLQLPLVSPGKLRERVQSEEIFPENIEKKRENGKENRVK